MGKRWPFFNEKDYGFMMENYGHDGVINDNGLGIGSLPFMIGVMVRHLKLI